MVKTSDGSSYTGLTSALITGKRYLYAVNFTKGRVDVYDNTFHRVELDAENQGESLSMTLTSMTTTSAITRHSLMSACHAILCLSMCRPSEMTL
jgi:hypothetical protein